MKKSLESIGAKIISNEKSSLVTFEDGTLFNIENDFINIAIPDNGKIYPTILIISCEDFYRFNWKLVLENHMIRFYPVNVKGEKIEEYKLYVDVRNFLDKDNNTTDNEYNVITQFSNLIVYLKSEAKRISPSCQAKRELYFN